MNHRKFWKFILSHLLFYVGHLVSRLMNVPGFHWLYFLYNWLMVKSAYLDDTSRVWAHRVQAGEMFLSPRAQSDSLYDEKEKK